MELLFEYKTLLGKRQLNEDAAFAYTSTTKNIFIICDGVGGSAKGEVAANLVANAVGNKIITENTLLETTLPKSIVEASILLKEYEIKNPESVGLATTIVAAIIQEREVNIAWCGDSRLYHVRNGEILYQTKDHSLVQQLINQGLLKEEQVKYHPRKNIVLHTVNSNMQLNYVETTKLRNIQTNDFFLLCTDGLAEVLTNQCMVEHFIASNTIENLQQHLLALTSNNTNDNCTWYLIQLV